MQRRFIPFLLYNNWFATTHNLEKTFMPSKISFISLSFYNNFSCRYNKWLIDCHECNFLINITFNILKTLMPSKIPLIKPLLASLTIDSPWIYNFLIFFKILEWPYNNQNHIQHLENFDASFSLFMIILLSTQ